MTPEAPEALRVLVQVVEALEELGLRYHVGGSYASSVHGVPRQTQDIDLVVNLPMNLVDKLVQSLSDDFFVQEDPARSAVQERQSFNAVHLDSGLKVDFFILGENPFDLEEFARHRAEALLENRKVFVKSPEDTVLRKLQWYRAGGEVSDRQWTDVVGILQTQGDSLDQSYMYRWATTLGIEDLLKTALEKP
jgi:hypothetical protein